jgi:hypothetical protein
MEYIHCGGGYLVVRRGREANLWLGERGKLYCGYEREGNKLVLKRGREAILWLGVGRKENCG